jgi:hypothetical protein
MANEVSPRIGGADRVEIRTSGTPLTSLGTLAVAVVIVASLYFGREVFVPVALAILLSASDLQRRPPADVDPPGR